MVAHHPRIASSALATPIERDKKRVSVKELKVGGSVVVTVVGDTPYDADLLVVGVRLVPAIPAKSAK